MKMRPACARAISNESDRDHVTIISQLEANFKVTFKSIPILSQPDLHDELILCFVLFCFPPPLPGRITWGEKKKKESSFETDLSSLQMVFRTKI